LGELIPTEVCLKKYHETGIFDENEIYPYVTEGIGGRYFTKKMLISASSMVLPR